MKGIQKIGSPKSAGATYRALVSSLPLLLLPTIAFATNYPCSGSKGGVDHCEGTTFICHDGSVSASKKSCSATMGGGSLGLMGSQPEEMEPTAAGECSCRSGKYCIGPRGGHFCTTDSGGKSYLRHD
jgi:hypothetical protein